MVHLVDCTETQPTNGNVNLTVYYGFLASQSRLPDKIPHHVQLRLNEERIAAFRVTAIKYLDKINHEFNFLICTYKKKQFGKKLFSSRAIP
jgi:hypothetical protein